LETLEDVFNLVILSLEVSECHADCVKEDISSISLFFLAALRPLFVAISKLTFEFKFNVGVGVSKRIECVAPVESLICETGLLDGEG
jgi:hypothetical protein